MDLEKDAYRYAIKNAYLHEGKADLGAVIGKLKALDRELKLKEAIPVLQEVIKKVNSMKFEDIENEYDKFKESYELKPQEKKEGLPDLDWAKEGKVVTRFAPNPNAPFHLGNARAAYMSYAFAEKYNGKFILRFEDTDPKIKKSISNAEEIFKEDLEWLGCKVDDTYFASDRMEIYYDYMIKVVRLGKAYVCKCKTEKWRKKIVHKEACPCREKDAAYHLDLLEKMLKHEIKEGEAVLRIKTDLKHPDPSVRDWWAARVVDRPQHPRLGTKYHVWPSYMFQCAIDDYEMGVTLIVRGQEHSQNQTKQEFLYNYFGWKYPHAFHFGRLGIEGVILSKSKIREGIEKGIYSGWDDPRLGTIKALRRRGFKAETIRKVLMDIGIKPNDSTLELSKMIDINKGLIEASAERFNMLEKPVKMEVGYSIATQATRDGKKFDLREWTQEFLVRQKDFKNIKIGSVVRLRQTYNVKVTKKGKNKIISEFVGIAKIKEPIVNWVLEPREIEIRLANNMVKKALGDSQIAEKKIGDYVYFDKFGFCRVDEQLKNKTVLWFTHE